MNRIPKAIRSTLSLRAPQFVTCIDAHLYQNSPASQQLLVLQVRSDDGSQAVTPSSSHPFRKLYQGKVLRDARRECEVLLLRDRHIWKQSRIPITRF
jgi:hypothetical protein